MKRSVLLTDNGFACRKELEQLSTEQKMNM